MAKTKDSGPAAGRRSRRFGERPTRARRWSQKVTEESNALQLEPGVFTLENPLEIARSLQRSAERSRRRKSEPFRSAMSMLTFYINRAGRGLSSERKLCLEQAKNELRILYSRAPRVPPGPMPP